MRIAILAIIIYILPASAYNPLPVGMERDRQICGEAYRVILTRLCSHGPDSHLFGYDPSPTQGVGFAPLCEGDGVSGKRVQAAYIRSEGQPDRYNEKLGLFRTLLAQTDAAFELSAQKTGGHRRIRYVTAAPCEVFIDHLIVPDGSNASLGATIEAVRNLGYTSDERKYILFVDADIYCGIATVYSDSQPGAGNRNNFAAGYARIDQDCWFYTVVAHELMHTLGGVQKDAPHASGGWHCIDEVDIMCYSDAPAYPDMVQLCPEMARELFDCGDDDYFSTNPAPGSYLADHWNTANSVFLTDTTQLNYFPLIEGAP